MRLAATGLLLAVAVASSAGSSAAEPPADTPPARGTETRAKGAGQAKAAVRAVLDAQVEAWNRGDLEGFMAGYWRSPDLVFCSGATVTKGWDATLARYRKRYQSEGREMGKLRFEGIEVLELGQDAAAVRGAYRLRMSDGKEPHGLFTLLLRLEAGAWHIIHDHTSSAE
jgi:beta-aspartyl-peptidase (threonine type)